MNCFQKFKLKRSTLEGSKPFDLRGTTLFVKVLSVYDGDTLTISFYFYGTICKGNMRLYGVDCAEIKSKDMEEKKVAIETKKFVEDLTLNKIFKCTVEKRPDARGRILGTLYLDNGETLKEVLIKNKKGYEYFGKGKRKKFREWYNSL